MLSSLCWIRKGAALSIPMKAELTEEKLEEFEKELEEEENDQQEAPQKTISRCKKTSRTMIIMMTTN
jgi:hypothetical protein